MAYTTLSGWKHGYAFTLSMVQKELTAQGRSRSIKEIKHAIEVMSSCIISLYKENNEVWKGRYFTRPSLQLTVMNI